MTAILLGGFAVIGCFAVVTIIAGALATWLISKTVSSDEGLGILYVGGFIGLAVGTVSALTLLVSLIGKA